MTFASRSGSRSESTPGSGPATAIEVDLSLGLGDLDLRVAVDIAAGEVLAVLGPNGAGKSTSLRALAGLTPIDDGRIVIAGQLVDEPATDTLVPPERRPVGVVFQDYLLFPHLTALENVAFGLRSRGVPRGAARAAGRQWLERLGLADQADRHPRQLSGGQAQRVALARALAPDPWALLLDEPLAALDVGTRGVVRRDLRRHLDEFGGATVLVTHDPLDALALADRVLVLEDGRVTQLGPIDELIQRPRSRYVAELVGLNLVRGRADGTILTVEPGGNGHPAAIGPTGPTTLTIADAAVGEVYALIHPHAVALYTAEPAGSPRNHWPGHVEGFDLLGDRVRVRVGGALPLVAEVTRAAVADLGLEEGTIVWAAVKATEITVYPA